MPRIMVKPAIVEPVGTTLRDVVGESLGRGKATQRLEEGRARNIRRARTKMHLESKQKRLELKRKQLDQRQKLLEIEWQLLSQEAIELDNAQSELDAERLAFNLNSEVNHD